MAKIDVSGWKEFIIGEQFEISRPITRSQMKYQDGHVAFVASGNFNNGVTKWCTPMEGEPLDAGNCITVSPLDGSAFYQKESFLGRGGAGSAILMLRNASLNESAGLFIASVVRHALTKYSYSDQLNSQTIADESIKLPVDSSGEPDWAYMGSYMSQMMQDAEASLDAMEQADGRVTAVDVSDWREFVIGDLFEQLETGFIGEGKKIGSATTEPDEVHTIPLTCAKAGNNGIMYYGKSGDFITYSNVIAVIRDGAISTGMVYAEPQETGVYSHSYLIRVKGAEVSYLTNLYLARVLETVIYPRYTRDDACIWDRIKEDSVPLPVDASGEPDWAYMDAYMSQVKDSADSVLSELCSVGGHNV